MEIKPYEPWMLPQIAEMFSHQYKVTTQEFTSLFINFYDHDYQKHDCIRVVAVEGETVCGFQSFFLWPYKFQGKVYRAFQSGNSLVHPHFRGKKIFQRLLEFIDQKREFYSIDLLIGFPIDQSRNSLLRNGWSNITDLSWYVKVINPAGVFFDQNMQSFSNSQCLNEDIQSNDSFRLTNENDFHKWRNHYRGSTDSIFKFVSANDQICFSLKKNKRSRFINELVIGDIKSSSMDTQFLKKALKKLSGAVLKTRGTTILTIALNDSVSDSLKRALRSTGFFKINKRIYFTVKPMLVKDKILRPELWTLYRSDIDTW